MKGENMANQPQPWVVVCTICKVLSTSPIEPDKKHPYFCSGCNVGNFYNQMYGAFGLVDCVEETRVNPNGGFVGIND